ARGVPRENVIAVPDDGSVTISNVTDTGLTLEGTNPAIPAIKSGTVMVSAKGAGLAVKVKSITVSGTQTMLETEPARITDIFSELEIHQRRSLDSIDVASVVTAPGVTFQGRSRDDGSITLQVSHVNPVAGGQGELDLTGQLQLSGSIDMDMQSDNI